MVPSDGPSKLIGGSRLPVSRLEGVVTVSRALRAAAGATSKTTLLAHHATLGDADGLAIDHRPVDDGPSNATPRIADRLAINDCRRRCRSDKQSSAGNHRKHRSASRETNRFHWLFSFRQRRIYRPQLNSVKLRVSEITLRQDENATWTGAFQVRRRMVNERGGEAARVPFAAAAPSPKIKRFRRPRIACRAALLYRPGRTAHGDMIRIALFLCVEAFVAFETESRRRQARSPGITSNTRHDSAFQSIGGGVGLP